MNSFFKVIVIAMVIAPAVYGRVLQGWAGAVDDFQDPVEERMDDMHEPQEERNFEPPSENFEPAPREYQEARSNNQGYFQDFAPKSIILDDNQSIESRFAFPDFPKINFPFDAPFGGERKQ